MCQLFSVLECLTYFFDPSASLIALLNIMFYFFYVVSLQPARCANQIEDVCKEVEKTINQTIQNTLNTLEKDCEKIADLVDKKLTVDT